MGDRFVHIAKNHMVIGKRSNTVCTRTRRRVACWSSPTEGGASVKLTVSICELWTLISNVQRVT
jgi:hypothetical protein